MPTSGRVAKVIIEKQQAHPAVARYQRWLAALSSAYPLHPTANRNAAQSSFIRAALNCATRFPKRACETVTVLCRFTAHRDFMPLVSHKATSEGTPRTVVVIGATVTVATNSIALFRVSMTTARFFSGGAEL